MTYTEEQLLEEKQRSFEDGRRHANASQETLRLMEEHEKVCKIIQEEWRSFKNRSLGILLGFIGLAGGYGVWVGTVNFTVNRNIQDIQDTRFLISQVAEKQQKTDVTSAEIRTKLSSIETTLIEIKEWIKK